MKFYSITEHPIKIYGLAVTDVQARKFWRLPQKMLEIMPQYEFLGKRAVGGRVRFCTDSENVTVKMTLAQAKEDINIPLSGSAGADIYLGRGKEASFLGYIAPAFHVMEEVAVEKNFKKKREMEVVTINLPRNDHLLSMEIGIDEKAEIKEAPTYMIEAPILFYGSSITEGGCAARVGNAYTSLVCRWLDADYRNYGFSGSARGEQEFAKYVTEHEKVSAFVYDYDHNAPDAEHLKATHEPFFRTIREKFPDLPILIMSRPDTDSDIEDSTQRRDIIFQTYQNAVQGGDDKVWFLDGGTFFGKKSRSECTVDGTHPNELGFMRMAEAVYPVLREMLDCE